MTDEADAPAVPLHVLEQRLEELATRVTSLTVADWAVACEVLCPELYAAPPASGRGLTCLPGSRTRRWRYAQRVAHGRQVHSPLDQTGPPVAAGAPPGHTVEVKPPPRRRARRGGPRPDPDASGGWGNVVAALEEDR